MGALCVQTYEDEGEGMKIDVQNLLRAMGLAALTMLAACGGGGGGGDGGSPAPGGEARRHAYILHRDATNSASVVSISAVASDGALSAKGSVQTVASSDSIATAADSKFLYVGNAGSISTYAVDAASGGLSYVADVASGTAGLLAVDPRGRFVFRGDLAAGISTFRIDTATGRLALQGTTATPGLVDGRAYVHPGGNFLYAPSYDAAAIWIYRVGEGGDLTLAGQAPLPERSSAQVAFNREGTLAFALLSNPVEPLKNRLNAYEVDAATGALTLVDIEQTGNAAIGLAAAQDGRAVYVVDSPIGARTITRYGFDAAAGDLTRLGTVATVGPPFRIQTDPDGRFAYVLELTPFAESNTVATYAIDPVARTLTQVAAATAGRNPTAIAFAN